MNDYTVTPKQPHMSGRSACFECFLLCNHDLAAPPQLKKKGMHRTDCVLSAAMDAEAVQFRP